MTEGRIKASFGPGAPKPQGGGGQGEVLEVLAAQIVDISKNFTRQKFQNVTYCMVRLGQCGKAV
jgi:hypothetical protein